MSAATLTESGSITGSTVLTTSDLRIRTTASGTDILHGVSFDLHAGGILALVGESGSGKTTAGLACMGHFRSGLGLSGGRVSLERDGETVEILDLSPAACRTLRGGSIAYVPQDPALSLNPAMRVGEQILEVLRIHDFGGGEGDRQQRVEEVLGEVGLPGDRAYRRRYPHQLSGGQQQRIGIAMAFACRPSVIVLDEPTTGLDVSTQALVLETIDTLTHRHDVAGLYITHDLAVVAQVADEVAVMLQGEIVEQAPVQDVLYAPSHRYTRRLIRAVPDLAGRHRIGEVEAVTTDEAVTEQAVTGRSTDAGEESAMVDVQGITLAYGSLRVLDSVDLQLEAGESTMLLGESGSGKTTLSRCIAGLNDRYRGTVALAGETLSNGTRHRMAEQRRRIQYVFQSPFSSLNPRRTIGESVEVPLRMSQKMTRPGRRHAVQEALEQVQLSADFTDRRPGELSGGERQRAAIARALVNAPSVLICDEVTSALDVSVQAAIIDLLRTLQTDNGMAMLFVTHNIALARHISQRLAVLQRGKIVELGRTDDVLEDPQHEYTQELLGNVPTL